jgi:hypothetical protein
LDLESTRFLRSCVSAVLDSVFLPEFESGTRIVKLQPAKPAMIKLSANQTVQQVNNARLHLVNAVHFAQL